MKLANCLARVLGCQAIRSAATVLGRVGGLLVFLVFLGITAGEARGANPGPGDPPASLNDGLETRRKIIGAFESVAGALPSVKRVPLEVNRLEEIDCGRYVRQKITYSSEPGNRVPAYLLIPKRPGRFPAVLALHPTNDRLGNQTIVGVGPETNYAYAAELAQRDFVVIAPGYPWLADYRPDLERLGYVSGTMKAIWDNIRAIDLLESLPEVRAGGVGVIGHSLGGHNGIFTALFDRRIEVIVSSCGFDSFKDYMNGDLRGWTSRRYMPRLLNYSSSTTPFDFDDLIAALSPRRCFVSAPIHDTNFKWRSTHRMVERAGSIYALDNATNRLSVVHPDCAHEFPVAIRLKAYDILEQLRAP